MTVVEIAPILEERQDVVSGALARPGLKLGPIVAPLIKEIGLGVASGAASAAAADAVNAVANTTAKRDGTSAS